MDELRTPRENCNRISLKALLIDCLRIKSPYIEAEVPINPIIKLLAPKHLETSPDVPKHVVSHDGLIFEVSIETKTGLWTITHTAQMRLSLKLIFYTLFPFLEAIWSVSNLIRRVLANSPPTRADPTLMLEHISNAISKVVPYRLFMQVDVDGNVWRVSEFILKNIFDQRLLPSMAFNELYKLRPRIVSEEFTLSGIESDLTATLLIMRERLPPYLIPRQISRRLREIVSSLPKERNRGTVVLLEDLDWILTLLSGILGHTWPQNTAKQQHNPNISTSAEQKSQQTIGRCIKEAQMYL